MGIIFECKVCKKNSSMCEDAELQSISLLEKAYEYQEQSISSDSMENQ